MQIGNFTPDEVKWTHQGISGKIHPGTVQEFNQGRGNFILNSRGKRGLVKLEWYDPQKNPDYMENKKKESYEQYVKYWTYQIQVMNAHNEQLKNESKPYVNPPAVYRQKAQELKLELLGRWQTTAPVPNAEVAALQAKNETLEQKVGTLTSQVEKLLSALQSQQPAQQPASVQQPVPEPEVTDVERLKKRFSHLSANQLHDWIIKNKTEVSSWPGEVLDVLAEKYEQRYGEPLDPSILE